MNNAVKNFSFSELPLGHKSMKSIPCLNNKAILELKKINFIYAYQLLGQYLILDNKTKFNQWLKINVPSLTIKKRTECIQLLESWINNNL